MVRLLNRLILCFSLITKNKQTKKINNKLLHLGIWQCAVVCLHNFDGPLLECFAALKVKRHDDDAS